jgi:hypothetical protein
MARGNHHPPQESGQGGKFGCRAEPSAQTATGLWSDQNVITRGSSALGGHEGSRSHLGHTFFAVAVGDLARPCPHTRRPLTQGHGGLRLSLILANPTDAALACQSDKGKGHGGGRTRLSLRRCHPTLHFRPLHRIGQSSHPCPTLTSRLRQPVRCRALTIPLTRDRVSTGLAEGRGERISTPLCRRSRSRLVLTRRRGQGGAGPRLPAPRPI